MIAWLSQRVEVDRERGERRDALDRRLVDWIAAAGYLPLPLPNAPGLVATLWGRIPPALVVLSGGNDLARYGGDAPERDELERELIRRCLATDTPLLAICRGMQLLLDEFGSSLERVEGHVRTRHEVELNGEVVSVNSFHTWSSREVLAPLRVVARAPDGCVEAVKHTGGRVAGIMWHPERDQPFDERHRELLLSFMDDGSDAADPRPQGAV